MNQVVRVTNLGQAFNNNHVLNGVSFSLEQRERLAVIGHSGSGKTTLLRLIAGLESPTDGEIVIAGKAASRAGEVLIPPEHREVALVFQGLALFPHLRALDQIAFSARGRGGLKQATRLLEQIGLGHRANARLDELSGGERQRIALARALAQQPKLILMDEPFASLDDEKRSEMRDLLRSLLNTTGTTLILVTHSRDDALDLAQRVIVLETGRAVVQDLLENVLRDPQHIAAVRTLGLGQIIQGETNPAGEIITPFGKVTLGNRNTSGRVNLLVRPSQPRIVTSGNGVDAEIIAIEVRPTDTQEIRRIAVVRVGGRQLRIHLGQMRASVGDRIQFEITGPCEPLAGA